MKRIVLILTILAAVIAGWPEKTEAWQDNAIAEAEFIISVNPPRADSYIVSGKTVSESPTQRMLLINIVLDFNTPEQAKAALVKLFSSGHRYFSNIKASGTKKRLTLSRNSQYDHMRPEQSVPETIKAAIREIAAILDGIVLTDPVVVKMKKEKRPPPRKDRDVKHAGITPKKPATGLSIADSPVFFFFVSSASVLC